MYNHSIFLAVSTGRCWSRLFKRRRAAGIHGSRRTHPPSLDACSCVRVVAVHLYRVSTRYRFIVISLHVLMKQNLTALLSITYRMYDIRRIGSALRLIAEPSCFRIAIFFQFLNTFVTKIEVGVHLKLNIERGFS